jgi:hypothetical protein
MSESPLSTDQYCDCTPGLTDDQKNPLLERLERVHKLMHAGKAYGIEQTIWCDTVREIHRLRDGLRLIATDEHRLMNETARQTAASILNGKPI